MTAWWWYNAVNEVTLKHKLSFFRHTSFTVAKDEGSGFSSNYLDNTNNNASNPNENYAREFLELFTILKGEQIGDGDYTNYTELDVQIAAKVL